MSEKLNVVNQTIKKKGHFNFKDLYEFCFLWLKENGYEVAEREYTEKDTGAKEVIIRWEAEKKVTDYFKWDIDMKWHILQMTDAKVERNGKQEETNKGQLKIVVKADVVTDYEGRWEPKPFQKFIRGVYDRYIIKSRSDQQEIDLEVRASKLISDIKSFLELSDK
jgi:hypothetical protein